ncbi:MAG: GNAT family N-acetyltransferase [Firmicutes bacterium]|nr:GNAT family N-acetyltransferase [Bacillota bacterium]
MITTERLILKPFGQDDLDIIYQLYSNREIMRYMPVACMDMEAAERHLNKIVGDWQKKPLLNMEMLVSLKDTGEKIGRCRIHIEEETESGMIGWLLLEKEWNKGYATEITKALINYCFDELGLRRVCALCNPKNIASNTVLQTCGLRKEGHYIEKCKYEKDGVVSWEDEASYAMLKSER